MGDLKLSGKGRGICLIAIVPLLRNLAGHEVHYHRAVSRAAELNGWKYVVAVPEDCALPDVAEDWIKCLKRLDILRAGMFRRMYANLKKFIRYVLSLHRFLNKQNLIAGPSRKIIFVESFNVTHLTGFALSSFFISRKNLSVWVLYRQEPVFLRYCFAYKTLNRILSFLFNSRVRLLTDSELLRDSLGSFFGRTVSLMPIPHANLNTRGLRSDLPAAFSGKIICWWPGPPRVEKGLDVLKKLSLSLPSHKDAGKLCLVVARNAKLGTGTETGNLWEIEDSLSISEYADWMSTADIILLPYDLNQYREATSGIFIECVVAGKIPIVTQGTWMAHELSKYDLQDLITDWSMPNLISRFVEISEDKNIKEKINIMRKACVSYHNEHSFAEAMKELANV
ncbi:MAG: hypothetical protein WC081_02635 [Candidatus Ratteibacteria bacterium]